jgi:hypothetical protein
MLRIFVTIVTLGVYLPSLAEEPRVLRDYEMVLVPSDAPVKALTFSASPLHRQRTYSPLQRITQSCGCSPPTPKCVINSTRNETLCCAANAVPCTSSKLTWCCAAGTYCSDDNGGCQ